MMSRGKLKECFGEFDTTGFYVDFMQIFQPLFCPLQYPLLRPNISTRIFNPNDFACKQKEPIIVAEVGGALPAFRIPCTRGKGSHLFLSDSRLFAVLFSWQAYEAI